MPERGAKPTHAPADHDPRHQQELATRPSTPSDRRAPANAVSQQQIGGSRLSALAGSTPLERLTRIAELVVEALDG